MSLKQSIKRDLTYYLQAHQHRTNQHLHYFAFLFAFLGWVFLLIDWRFTILFAVLHYALSWIGHFYFEGNKPASFRYPWVGFYAGFLWFFLRTYEFVTRRQVISRFID
ncbi:DUF962 domain-containing protein [Paenibacillus daejeonensis]|uniref:DUF962 domain-containing protein n=1 Tax=Paenibacillus daejeonensis TaxID=135193 RepID=UPI00035D2F35|nr:DUF962 domain-containing protein [Paenibacillus daejeonensis]